MKQDRIQHETASLVKLPTRSAAAEQLLKFWQNYGASYESSTEDDGIPMVEKILESGLVPFTPDPEPDPDVLIAEKVLNEHSLHPSSRWVRNRDQIKALIIEALKEKN